MDATEPQTVEETGGADGVEVSQAPEEPQNGEAEATPDAAPEAPTETDPPAEQTPDAEAALTEADTPAEQEPDAVVETLAADADGNGQEQATDTPTAAPEETTAQTESQDLPVPETDNNAASQEDIYGFDFSETSENADTSAEHVEAGAVVPVPVPTSDARSREEGEGRGEDHSEVHGGGGDNSRGAGIWKSEEEAYMESSLVKQHADQEALQAVIDEKVKLQREYDELQVRYLALEKSSKKWGEENSMLKERYEKLETRIKELEAREAQLTEFEAWGKDNDAKVKDLQSRLGILAGEDAEKDRRIQKLEEDLRDTNSRLINAERQAAIGAESMHHDPPKSKTCAIM